ncbi:MAG TPA: glycosyltransferase family 4 protein, partial [Rhizomicrobium sp.]
QDGLEQTAIIRPNAAHQIGRLSAAGIRHVTTAFNPWFIQPSRRAIANEIARFKPDIIQYWTGRAAMTAVKTTARQIGWFGGYRDRWRYSTCTHFIGITDDLVRHIREQGVEEKDISLVHTFAERVPAEPIDRGQFDTPGNVPLLLALARLHKDKALDVLLPALQKVPEAYLWIAGEGPELGALSRQVRSLGLSERVRFLGWRNDREALLATADLCVFPSREEPFGTVILEAWAAGIPLIAAAAQGPAAYVKDGENGLLVPIDDADALATAISRAIGDPSLRGRLVERGRKEYETQFTKEVYVKAMQKVYAQVMR